MPGHADPGFDTLSIHAGAQPDPATGARAVDNKKPAIPGSVRVTGISL